MGYKDKEIHRIHLVEVCSCADVALLMWDQMYGMVEGHG